MLGFVSFERAFEELLKGFEILRKFFEEESLSILEK